MADKLNESDKLARKAWLAYVEQREKPTRAGAQKLAELWGDVAHHLTERASGGE